MSVQAVLFDWGGTTVDYGSRAPMQVFVELFQQTGITITEAEARGPMGQAKRDHVAAILSLPRVQAAWQALHQQPPTSADVDQLYANFLPMQRAILARGTDVIPGIVRMSEELRARGIKIGSTTGYTRMLMEVVVPAAQSQGFTADCVICADDVQPGRPAPWLNHRACEQLGVWPPTNVVVVDDTIVGIQAARNAGMWAVGVSMTGNGLGLTHAAANSLPETELNHKLATIRDQYLGVGAHYVLRSAADLIPVIDEINSRLSRGEKA